MRSGGVAIAAHLLTVPAERGGGLSQQWAGVVALALFGTWLAWRTLRVPFSDSRAAPRLARVMFVVLSLVLLLAGGALLAGRPDTPPWAVTPELGTITGLIFLGAAVCFANGVVRPAWTNAGGQLGAFLVYDLVLVLALATSAGSAPSCWRDSLWIYLAVLLLSAAVAAWYLLLDPRTRLGSGRAEARAARA